MFALSLEFVWFIRFTGGGSSCLRLLFFFFKQKTAYEMRISDWSSDVCSSDLVDDALAQVNNSIFGLGGSVWSADSDRAIAIARRFESGTVWKIGRASCRERVCQYV